MRNSSMYGAQESAHRRLTEGGVNASNGDEPLQTGFAMRIFIHSLKLIFDNFGQALRLTLLPYLAVSALSLLVFPLSGGDVRTASLLAVVPAIANGITALWAAVAWHRFILLDETAVGWVAPLKWDRIAAYFVRSIIVGLLFVPLLIAFAILNFTMMGLGGGVGTVAAVVVMIFAVLVISYRLSPVLVAAALGAPLPIAQAWEATRGHAGEFLGLSVLSLISVGVVAALTWAIGRGNYALAMAWDVIAEWGWRIGAISIITTIYGHYVEKRPIG